MQEVRTGDPNVAISPRANDRQESTRECSDPIDRSPPVSASDWTPRPIDTSSVRLPADLEALTERLAENTHDIWARQRLAEGWRYGPARDDVAKRHPDLVPYAELAEGEKQYDRATAMETLKAIVALGYRIERRGR
jgi:hypothetical protein